jgi:hypothetical protein
MTEEVEIEEDEKSPSNFERVDGEAGRGSLYENIEEDEIKQENTEKNTPPNNGTPAIDCLDSISLTKNEDMKNQIAGILMAVATATTPLAAQDTLQTDSVQSVEMQQQTKCKPAQLTFIYPLGTGGAKASKNCYHFSVNVLGGVTGQTRGFEAGGLFNINKYGNWGAQFAGLFNIAGAKNTEIMSHNVQFAGLFNHTQKGTSVQFAGLWNTGDTAYLQGAGLFNVAKEVNFQGAGLFNIAKKADVQAAGLFNTSTESYAQLAGLFNQGETAHFQAAGLWNNAKETKCQLAGLVNIAQESSCQIAGILNITKKGCFQMGLINVRDTADGVSLGLINIVKKGGVLEAGIEAGEFMHTAVTFRSGVKRLYTIIYVGCNFGSTRMTWAVGVGLGTSVKLIGNLSLDFELTHASFYSSRLVNNWGTTLTQFRPVLNYRFAKHFKMYAGPTLNLYTETERWWGPSPQRLKVPYSFLHRSYNNTTLDLWVGVVGGIKF